MAVNHEDGQTGCQQSSICPVEYTMDVIGGKWKCVLLYHLTGGAKRFNELRRACPAISQRMLTLQLRELERDGIIHREVHHQVPPKVEYSLTGLGRTLVPIIQLIRTWGLSNSTVQDGQVLGAAGEKV